MRLWLKRLLIPLLYRRPVPELPPERLYLLFDALVRTRALSGAIVEVGCFQCGTSAWAYRMLRALGLRRRYICVDTFGGFVDDQFTHDVGVGTAPQLRSGFRINSAPFVRTLLERWGVSEIELLPADVVALPASQLPGAIAVALLDVDLDTPTYAALEKVYPRLAPGGIILVDDCSDDASNPFRGARAGSERFTREHGLPSQFTFGMGIVGGESGLAAKVARQGVLPR
jgi:O-methyltransferase